MKKLYILTVISCMMFLQSCNFFKKKDKVADNPKSLALVIGNPFDLGLDSVIAFPVGANYNPKINENDDQNAETGNDNAVLLVKIQ